MNRFLALALLLIGSVAQAATPTLTNFNSGDFTVTPNAPVATNVILGPWTVATDGKTLHNRPIVGEAANTAPFRMSSAIVHSSGNLWELANANTNVAYVTADDGTGDGPNFHLTQQGHGDVSLENFSPYVRVRGANGVQLWDNRGSYLNFSDTVFSAGQPFTDLGWDGEQGVAIYTWANLMLTERAKVYGYLRDGNNYSRINVYHGGTNNYAFIDSDSAGDAGVPRGIMLRIGGTNVLLIASDIGPWPNNAAKYLDGSGHLSTPTGAAQLWEYSAPAVRLVTQNNNQVLKLSADDNVGSGDIQFWTAGVQRWSLVSGALAPTLDNQAIGSSIHPINQGWFTGPAGISLGNRGVTANAGSPEGVTIGEVGAIYIQTDGTSGNTLWTKATGSSTTGWVLHIPGGNASTTNYFNNTWITNLYSDTINVTNITVQQDITVKGNANLTILNVGSATITNSTSRIMTTTWTAASAGTNFVVDVSLPVLQWNMTTNLNIIHATNGTANFTANQQKECQVKIINNSGTNFPVSFPTTWKRFGSVAASPYTLTNGDWCIMAVQFAGVSTSQTNIDVAVAYKNF